MTDEKYLYQQDIRDKKITARSARNTRTHNGKRGAVRFPSDNLSRKELNAMNGEVKTYRLNEPMNWKDFKAMPEEHKVAYIKALRQKYGVSDSTLAKMFGIGQVAVSKEMRLLGLGAGRFAKKEKPFDKEGWLAWVNGVPVTVAAAEDTALEEPAAETEAEQKPVCAHTEKAIPQSGIMTFVDSADKALAMVAAILGGANVCITISWELNNNG